VRASMLPSRARCFPAEQRGGPRQPSPARGPGAANCRPRGFRAPRWPRGFRQSARTPPRTPGSADASAGGRSAEHRRGPAVFVCPSTTGTSSAPARAASISNARTAGGFPHRTPATKERRAVAVMSVPRPRLVRASLLPRRIPVLHQCHRRSGAVQHRVDQEPPVWGDIGLPAEWRALSGASDDASGGERDGGAWRNGGAIDRAKSDDYMVEVGSQRS
jgi:hypothetical protein